MSTSQGHIISVLIAQFSRAALHPCLSDSPVLHCESPSHTEISHRTDDSQSAINHRVSAICGWSLVMQRGAFESYKWNRLNVVNVYCSRAVMYRYEAETLAVAAAADSRFSIDSYLSVNLQADL